MSMDDKLLLFKSLIRKKSKEIEIASKNAAEIPEIIFRANSFLWVMIFFTIYLCAVVFLIENILKNILRKLLRYGFKSLFINGKYYKY